jgi:hypothetical protein
MSIRPAVNIGTLTSRLLVSGLFLGLIILEPSTAASQQSNAANQAPNTGQDFFKPPANLFQLLYGYRTAPGSGDATVTTDTLNLRLDHRIDLSQQSVIALRTDLPLLAKNPITSGNPNGDYLYGMGDFDAQALYIRLRQALGGRLWSSHDCADRLGRIEQRKMANHAYRGFPLWIVRVEFWQLS